MVQSGALQRRAVDKGSRVSRQRVGPTSNQGHGQCSYAGKNASYKASRSIHKENEPEQMSYRDFARARMRLSRPSPLVRVDSLEIAPDDLEADGGNAPAPEVEECWVASLVEDADSAARVEAANLVAQVLSHRTLSRADAKSRARAVATASGGYTPDVPATLSEVDSEPFP